MLLKLSKFAILLALSACASTSVTPVAKNKIIINTSAAPICNGSGAQSVAAKMAAIETLRRGYQRFVIVGIESADNVSVTRTGPTYAYTNSSYQGIGNSVYGNSTTRYGGGSTIVSGSHDTALGVIMLNPGDPGFENGVDAKSALGGKWQELVKKGVSTCA